MADVQLAAWQAGYSDLLPPEVLAGPPAELAQAWLTALSAPPSPRHQVFVALDGARLVGFLASTPGDAQETELATLLVDPPYGRRGHASRLLAAATESWRGQETGRAWYWVWDSDRSTRSFLLSAGWGLDGGHRLLETGAGAHRQVRLHTDLTATV